MAGGTLNLAVRATRKPTRTPRMSKYKSVYKASRNRRRNAMPKKFLTNSPFPPVKLYHLNYSSDINLQSNVTAGLFGSEHVFRLNSLFDPDKTATGHQPYGFDQLAAVYNRYKVVGATLELTINDPTVDGMAVGWMFTNPSNLATSLSSTNMDISPEIQQTGVVRINDTGSQTKRKVFKLSMARLAGLTNLQFKADPDNYTAPVTSNCGNELALHIASGTYRGTTSESVFVHVKITYHAMFYQRKIMPVS